MSNGDIVETSILVKHIPKQFSLNDCKELFSFFKFKNVTYFNKPGPMQHSAIVSFDCYRDAYTAVFTLHERRILNTRLCAQFLKVKTNYKNSEGESTHEKRVEDSSPNKVSHPIPDWISKLLSVAPKWGLNGPIQPKLKYNYPKPNNIILTNIVRSLIANENFYTQTLHLMNKFHFPVPFTADITFPGNIIVVNNEEIINSRSLKRTRGKNSEITEMEISSGNESEISDEENCLKIKRRKISFPKIPSNPLVSNYEFKIETLKSVPINDVFENKDAKSESHIAFRPISSLPEVSDLDNQDSSLLLIEGFGKMPELVTVNSTATEECHKLNHITPNIDENNDSLNFIDFKLRKEKINKNSEVLNNEKSAIQRPNRIISLDEIKINILPETEWKSVNALKNYQRGIPSNQLYIKNISKKVTKDDIISLYAGFIDWSKQSEISAFQINYFTEGRMKGQAFVSFESQSVAQKALEITNAFRLIDKAISVQFSKNSNL